MKISEIFNLKHFVEYTVEQIINSIPLNRPLLLEFHDSTLDGELDFIRLNELVNSKKTVLLNCLKCGQAMPFTKKLVFHNPLNFLVNEKDGFYSLVQSRDNNPRISLKDAFYEKFPVFTLELQCTLNPNHKMYLVFEVEKICYESFEEWIPLYTRCISNQVNDDERLLVNRLLNTLIVRKIGQYPEATDLSIVDFRKYSKILGKRVNELKCAVSLYNKNYAVGAYTYLRRVLEYVMELQHVSTKDIEGFNEDDYRKFSFVNRIKYLEKFGIFIFPKEMQAIKGKLYELLSKGIHELEEEECKSYFTEIRLAIELILDKLVQEKEKEKKMKEICKKISEFD